jgi:hypothetical protein
VRCFRDAVNNAALAALLNCFTPRGVVIDVGRGSGGFLAHYRFVTRNGKLALVDMQYPG